jgi:hypothetical protein
MLYLSGLHYGGNFLDILVTSATNRLVQDHFRHKKSDDPSKIVAILSALGYGNPIHLLCPYLSR